MPMFDPNEVNIDFMQLSLFDDKQFARGLRANAGVMDDAGIFTVDPYYQHCTTPSQPTAEDVIKAIEEATRRVGVRM